MATDEYQSLLTPESGSDKSNETSGLHLLRNTFTGLIHISTFVMVACLIVDVALILYFTFGLTSKLQARLDKNIDSLPIANTYVDFDNLYDNKRTTTQHPPIINRARNFIHVSSEATEQSTVFLAWPSMKTTEEGNVPVLENHLLVTPHVSTIVQFRVLDYGMEECTLILELPAQNTTFATISVSSTLEGQAPNMDVWKLSAVSRLDSRDISWKTKPRRIDFIGIFPAIQGRRMVLSKFPCHSGSYPTFELSCEGNVACYIEGTDWGHTSNPLFYINQSQTI